MEFTLIIDSGIGGFNQALMIKRDFPLINILYFADNKHCPYGNKSEKFLIHRAFKIINTLSKIYNINRIILACNTLSSCALAKLKKALNIEIFETQPPVLNKENLLLCTPRTASILSQKKKYSFSKILPLKDLASLIENKNLTSSCFHNYILENIYEIKKYSHIVLGCTHYSYILPCLFKINPLATFHDSNTYTYMIYKNNLHNTGESLFIFACSGKKKKIKLKIKQILKGKNIIKLKIMYCHINC